MPARSDPGTKPRVLGDVILAGRKRLPLVFNGEIRIAAGAVDLTRGTDYLGLPEYTPAIQPR